MRRVPRRFSMVGCCVFAALLSVLGLSGCSGGFQGSTPGSSSTGGQSSSIKVTQPVSVTVVVGQTATFSVTATGTGPLPISGCENGMPITGATGSTYTTSATAAGQSGTVFTVVVTNAARKCDEWTGDADGDESGCAIGEEHLCRAMRRQPTTRR